MSEESSFNQLLNEIYDAEPEEGDESQDTLEAPTEEAPEESPPSETDTPDESPAEEAPEEEAPEETEEVQEPEAEARVEEPEEEAPVDTPEPTPEPEYQLPEGFVRNERGEVGVEIDGEFFPFEELRRGWLRQADYTRKTQELAQQRSQLAAQYQEAVGLTTDIATSENMQAFVQAHPEVLPYLLQNPAATRELLNSPTKLQQFWEQYEVVAQSPELQRKLLEQTPQAVTPEIRQRAQEVQLARNVLYVATGLEQAVDYVAQEYEGVDPNEVKQWILELGGCPQIQTQQDAAMAFGRLYQMFYDPSTRTVSNFALIKDRFEYLRARQAPEEGPQSEAEEHNKQVDEALKAARERPPATPAGDAPGPQPDEVKEYDSFRAALDALIDED